MPMPMPFIPRTFLQYKPGVINAFHSWDWRMLQKEQGTGQPQPNRTWRDILRDQTLPVAKAGGGGALITYFYSLGFDSDSKYTSP